MTQKKKGGIKTISKIPIIYLVDNFVVRPGWGAGEIWLRQIFTKWVRADAGAAGRTPGGGTQFPRVCFVVFGVFFFFNLELNQWLQYHVHAI